MKFTLLIFVILALLASLANLAFNFGFIGSAPSEYRALTPKEMNDIGFTKLAEQNGIEVGEDGKITFPKEMRDRLLMNNILPFTIHEIEKEGWRFVTVTAENLYLFRKS